jgi:selenocysteine lyase/cysteine desulfurase
VSGVDGAVAGRLDVVGLRAATPGCGERVHLDNAGAALPTRATLDAVIGHLELEARVGGYEAAELARPGLERARADLATLLGARPDEVALTTSDTAAWSKAFWGFVLGGGLRRGDRVVVDQVVYNSHHFAVLQARDRLGVEVEVLPRGADGGLDLDALARSLGRPTGLVTVTHVPTHTGAVNPVREVGAIARAAGVPFFLDACQSLGQLPVDVGDIGCDVLTATGRKWLRGPRGTGVLFVADHLQGRMSPPGIDASSATWVDELRLELSPGAARFEEFERSHAALVGLGNAVAELLDLGVDAVAARVGDLAAHLRERLAQRPGVEVHDGPGPVSGIVTFTVAGRGVDEVVSAARGAGVAVGASPATVARIDLGRRGLEAVVRASAHVFNTHDELDRLVELL